MPQQPPAPPQVTTVEIVATQPTAIDRAALAEMKASAKTPAPEVAYVVKVRLETKPPVTSQAWALYVDDVRIPKYWEYEHGIYFTVVDRQFFADHKEQKLRFSQDGVEFFDTGVKLTAPTAPPTAAAAAKSKGKAPRLPKQADVLK